MRVNKLRELLKENKPSIGTHIHSTWPGVVELIGLAGTMDYVEFLAEYAPYTPYDFENMARAAELYGMSSMIKVEQPAERYLAQKAIRAGIQNVLFVDCRTAEDVKRAVQSIRAEAPQGRGLMGCAMGRDVGYVLECGSKEYVQALDDAVVGVMIEKRSAIENLEEILSVEGLDMVQFGPCDYSMSIGKPGEWDAPSVVEAERKMIKTALKLGVAPRVEIDPWSLDKCKEYMDLGVRHFSIGWDVAILYEWIKEKGVMLREELTKVFGA